MYRREDRRQRRIIVDIGLDRRRRTLEAKEEDRWRGDMIWW